jgi:glutamine amidotransferase
LIAIIDYDVGNLAAVANMLKRLGHECEITFEPDVIKKAKKIILPGNGSFDACMENLSSINIIPLLEEKVFDQHTPLLGICVGAQMLGNSSEEGSAKGLGWIDMVVKRLPNIPDLRIPNMGWRTVKPALTDHYLLKDVDENARYYFVHSYYMQPTKPENVLLTTNYGIDFAAGVIHKNIIGVQFHPEKSHRYGKQLLNAFASGDLIE